MITDPFSSEPQQKTKIMNRKDETKRRNVCDSSHDSFSVHDIRIIGYLSQFTIPIWARYCPVAHTKVEDRLNKL